LVEQRAEPWLAYVAQAIAPGDCTVLLLHAEAMYNPETYVLSAPATLRVLRDGPYEARR
jgi:hypothetical protein